MPGYLILTALVHCTARYPCPKGLALAGRRKHGTWLIARGNKSVRWGCLGSLIFVAVHTTKTSGGLFLLRK
ncbi:hypothetical protein SAMN05660368_01224 [Marvinbryantia formatexigens]|nr:hypothetical protein SAMN05660368_01224 [Marvinbryantia formatexigens]